jgi:hypothetical protein
MKIFQGQMPDVTPAQVIAVLLAGVPVVATLLHSFGVYEMTAEQQDALSNTLQWAGLLGVGLFGADAGVRAARNHADAKVKAAQLPGQNLPPMMPGTTDTGAAVPLAPNDDLRGTRAGLDAELPSDHEEFGALAPYDEEDLTNGRNELDPALPTDEEEFAELDPDHDRGPDSRMQPVGAEEDML